MEFETVLQHMKNTKTTKLALVEKAINNLINNDEEDLIIRLEELIEVAISNNKWVGSASDFHNLAVTFARLDQEDRACEIVEKGLLNFPNNVNLLSDYLIYGVDCYEFENCEKFYLKLLSISKERWNWRAFTFTISYLLETIEFRDLTDEMCSVIRKNAEDLASEFQKHHPNNEQAYISQANIYKDFNNYEKRKEILLKAIELLPVAPKCLLQLASLYFEEAEFSKSLECLKHCEIYAVQPNSNIDIGYLYLLLTLNNVIIYYKSVNDTESKEIVFSIYKYYRIANKVLYKRAESRNLLRELIKIVEIKSEIEYYE